MVRASSLALVLALLAIPARADDPDPAESYRNEVVPLLERYCVKCHGPETAKGELNLRAFGTPDDVLRERKLWGRLLENVEAEIMPPEGEPAPSHEERIHLARWVEATLSKADCTIEHPGRVTLRRLNRAEYDNTIRDLLGLDIHPAAEFPLDDVGYGFDTIGDVLALPPMLLEKYLAAAERIAEAAIVVPGRPDGVLHTWTARALRGDAGDADGGRILASEGELGITHDFDEPGRYRLRVHAHGQQAGDEPVRMAVRVDGATIQTFDVTANADEPGEYEAEVTIEQPGKHRFAFAFVNDYYNPEHPDPKQRDRNLVVASATLHGRPTPPLWPLARVGWRELEGGEAAEHAQARKLEGDAEIASRFEAPADGFYRVEVHAHTDEGRREPARLAWQIDGRPVGESEVFNTWDSPGRFTIDATLPAGAHRVTLRSADGKLFLHDLAVLSSAPAGLTEAHKRIVTRRPSSDDDWRACANEVLEPLVSRAFRRPARPDEVDRLAGLVVLAQRDGEPFERGIQLALEATLVSPHFLYRVEVDRRRRPRGEADPGPVRPLTDWELASRLSYFLWSSMPDDELFQLARGRKLQDDAVLEAQARRMLKDPKAQALVENFAGQWLHLRLLEFANPNPRRFKGFDKALKDDMRRETELFFASVIADDRSILDLIDTDYTFLNERLARHYGIPGVEGDQFRRVDLAPDSPRGGILTQASILTLTSNPTRTSPVKRGKWILEQVLGTPPLPPPADVPPLPDDKTRRPLEGTLRQRLEQHRADASCAVCHAKLDPLGFGFENFDAVGAWRDTDGGAPVDASGTLPGGQSFQGVEDLKTLLREEKSEQFTRCLVEKLLTYGLGRGLEPYDACVVDAIVPKVQGDGHRFSRLVVEIVQSDPFRKRSREEEALR